jgi:hypothetical protein
VDGENDKVTGVCQITLPLIHENELFGGVGWGTSMEVNIISG